ncbi:hypothetical protein ABZR88_00310 [Mucilaginibacter yixingensis]|nr:hypothetical protein [Mucilaginibacter yixingensis]
MKKLKYILVLLAACAVISSCGIFKKNCNCPHFGMQKTAAQNLNKAR